MYGNDLSSRRRTLNGGRCLLTRFCSRWSASTSLPVTITSTSATRAGRLRICARPSVVFWKYERTRGRSDFALPTQRTWPSASRHREPPRSRGRQRSCFRTRAPPAPGGRQLTPGGFRAVRDPSRVGTRRHLDPGLGSAAEGVAVRVDHLARLAHRPLGDARTRLCRLDHAHRRDERRHEVRTVVEHELDRLIVEVDAVRDRAHDRSNGVLVLLY